MEIKCAWCNKIIGIKTFKGEELKTPLVTHSICTSCRKEVLKDKQLSAGAFKRTGSKAASILK
jgi:uncharacterized protein YlaI